MPQNLSRDDNGEESLQWRVLSGNNVHRIGANAGVCVYKGYDEEGRPLTTRVLFDAGLMSGDLRRPEHAALAACDTIIPDLRPYLAKEQGDDAGRSPVEMLDAIFLTHSHPDHVGALPFLTLMGYDLPRIYATPYTARRLEQEYSNAGLPPEEWPEIRVIAAGRPIREGAVSVTGFWVSHSTPQSMGFYIETPKGNILQPGDFKLDQTVIWGPAFSEAQFKKVVRRPVDLLLMDSTGADKDIQPVTEEAMREAVRDIMAQHPDKRFIVAVMGGFEENLASVARVTAESGRTLWIAGLAHEQSLSALQQTGMTLGERIGESLDMRILAAGRSSRDLAQMAPKESVVVVTGAQGKPNAALTRAMEGRHNALELNPETDVILICAPSIPGQEAGRERLLYMLRKQGFKVYTRAEADLYAHAHARLPEIIDMAKLTGAKTVLPVHGDAALREDCAKAMEKIGQPVIRAENGHTVHISREGCSVTKEMAALLGFKTLTGSSWNDRHYLMTETPKNENIPSQETSSISKRPKIFGM